MDPEETGSPSDHQWTRQVNQLRELVVDEPSFARFLLALANEADDAPKYWENPTLYMFLESASAWSSATSHRVLPSENPWRRCADILAAGRIYE